MSKDTQMKDQQGVGFITQILAKIGCGFNEYHREVGIDGIVEIRDGAYRSSGKLLGVQLKSGESFFSNSDENYYYVYIDHAHVDYWLKCTMPVLFIVYSPMQNEAYWSKIDKKTLITKRKSYKIPIPKTSKLSTTKKDDLYAIFYGKLYKKTEEFEVVHQSLKELKNYERNDIYVSGLEIFLNGLMDTCNQLYFHTDLYMNLMELKIIGTELSGFCFPKSIFFDNYFEIINYHNIIAGDFSFEIETISKRNLLPQFIKPLSLNGTRFVSYLSSCGYEVHDRIFVNVERSSFVPYIEQVGDREQVASANAKKPRRCALR